MQAFLHWVEFTHVEISWCSTGLVIDVNFVALIKNVSFPFQTMRESVSCLVGLVWVFLIHLAQGNSFLLVWAVHRTVILCDALDLFQRCCWNWSHFTAASAGVSGDGKIPQNISESLLQGFVLSFILQDAPDKKCIGTSMAPALPDSLTHRKLNQRLWNIRFSLVSCSTQMSMIVQYSLSLSLAQESWQLWKKKPLYPHLCKASREASLKQLLLDSNHRPPFQTK